jgi:hypothetical protein
MPEFLLQDWVMSVDAEFGTTGFLSLTEMLIFDMSKAVVKNAFCEPWSGSNAI